MDYANLQKRMVQEQLIRRGIAGQRLLQTFLKVPRHNFVLKRHLSSAYADLPLAIGAGQTISQPFMVALMTQTLQLDGRERVLEIGAGSGYQSAILAELTTQVYTVERILSLKTMAERNLQLLGYQNVRIKAGDGTLGWRKFAPFDRIIVTAAAPKIPLALIGQLNNNGRLVIPIGGRVSQVLTVVQKRKNSIETREVCGCIFVPLIGRYGWNA